MKLLLDSCLSHRLAKRLGEAGHDVVSADQWSFDPGDPEILSRAIAESRILVTLDKGFGRLAFDRHTGIILIRNMSPLQYFELILRALEMFGADLGAGAMVVIGRSGMRRRSPFDADA